MFESFAWDRVHKAEIKRRKRKAASCAAQVAEAKPTFFFKHLLRGEKLFSCGDLKEFIYRVESGLICLVWDPPNALPEKIEDFTANAVFGLGYHDCHIYSAVAVVDSTVSCWPKSALPFLAEHSPSVNQSQADAIEREIAHVRSVLVASTANDPLCRLATFLSVLSHRNAAEGRDPRIVDDSMQCRIVADYLKMDIETLSNALIELEHRGIISLLPPHRLLIRDLERLDRFTAAP
jgi:CRP/FNR family transcriptional regulator